MPRPHKKRRIFRLPDCDSFVPGFNRDWELEPIIMTVDEFETIRLIDYEAGTQETCAADMQVARTTVQAVYNNARRKIALCLVQGRALFIKGGNYEIGGSRTLEWRKKMKIAVAYEDGKIFQHFGKTEEFKFYEVEEGKVALTTIVPTNESAHSELIAFLEEHGIDTLICGGIGSAAQEALTEAGIKFYGGVSGQADAAVEALLAGHLAFDPKARCHHHGTAHDTDDCHHSEESKSEAHHHEGHSHGEGHGHGGCHGHGEGHDHGEGHGHGHGFHGKGSHGKGHGHGGPFGCRSGH